MKIKIKTQDIVINNDTKKFLILLIFVFILSVIIVSAVPSEWISVQQISKDNNGLIPADSDANGLIDNYGSNIPNSVISNFSSWPQYISGKQLYLTTEGSFYVLCINETETQYQGYCAWFGLV
jgi:hypothetical protein